MLRIKSLHLKDFGAFKGEQAFDLPDEEGVTVFYGENMRGKTTLLNAFRFALFGARGGCTQFRGSAASHARRCGIPADANRPPQNRSRFANWT